MNKMPDPQTLRTRRTRGFALATATTLLLAAVVVLLVGPATRPAEALPPPGGMNLAPVVAADNPSVVVNERQTATNSGSFEDLEEDGTSDTVRITASEGTVTQSGTRSGAWSWSMAVGSVPADETKTITITATDSREASSKTTFSLTVKDVDRSANVDPPANDSFRDAAPLELPCAPSALPAPCGYVDGNTALATMEKKEPRPYSLTKDCGITGVSNSVWFKFTIPSDYSSWSTHLRFYTGGSSFDTVLALYKGSSLGTLQQVECSNDNYFPNWTDSLSVGVDKLSAGQTYYLQLSGTGGARSGEYRLALA
jgi:hypothetical protein